MRAFSGKISTERHFLINRNSLEKSDQMENSSFAVAWFTPDSPEDILPGQMDHKKFDFSRITLNQPFSDEESRFHNRRTHLHPVVHGTTEGGMTVSATRVGIHRFTPLAQGATGKYDYYCEDVYFGKGPVDPSTRLFTSAQCDIDPLTDWLDRFPFNYLLNGNLSYEEPETIRWRIPSHDLEITIHGFPTSFSNHRKYEIEHREILTIFPDEPQLSEYLRSIALEFCAFLGIVSGLPIRFNSFRLKGDTDDDQDWYEHTSFRLMHNYHERHARKSINYAWDVVCDHVPSAIINWFSLEKNLKACGQALYGSIGRLNSPIESELLLAANAIENLCYGMNSPRLISPNAFERLVTSLTRAIPQDFPTGVAEVLQSKIEKINTRSLSDNIDWLLEQLDDITRKEMCLHDDNFSMRFVRTRNSITHPTIRTRPDPMDISADYQGMMWQTKAVRLLATHHLLLKLGFPGQSLEHRFYRCVDTARDLENGKLHMSRYANIP